MAVGYDELARVFGRACDWARCGAPVFNARDIPELARRTLIPGLPDDGVLTSTLERWSLPTNFYKEYAAELRGSRRVRLVSRATCLEIVVGDQAKAVSHLVMSSLDRRRFSVRAKRYVLACGGLETTRLLLASETPSRVAIGNHSGHLGRWYMSHIDGSIARAHFTTPPGQTIFDHERDAEGVYVRRRFSFARDFLLEHELSNQVAWLVNPNLSDPSHGNPVLSFAHLALTSPLGKYSLPKRSAYR